MREFWEQHDAWEDRVELARKAGHIGDVLVLADEARSPRFAPMPGFWRAKPCARPSASTSRWNNSNVNWTSSRATYSYAKGYRRNQSHYYSGINALTLIHLHRHLIHDTRYDREMAIMAGAVRFGAECESDEGQWFWSQATLGDLEVLVGTPGTVKAAYKEAIAKNDKDWFALNSSRAQLQMLKDLGFHSENVDAGIATFDRALQKLTKPEDKWKPRQVFRFSGHLIDTPDRATLRFPPAKESIAAQKIAEALDRLGAGPDDLVLTQGACGGDLLFTEACQQRGVKVHWLQPFREPDFIEKSVVPGGESWRNCYLDAKAKLAAPIRSTPEELGDPPPNSDPGYPYERCNLWLLYTALARGVDKVRFVCLWNGGGGDGPGGQRICTAK